jgi:hypothetical protein
LYKFIFDLVHGVKEHAQGFQVVFFNTPYKKVYPNFWGKPLGVGHKT